MTFRVKVILLAVGLVLAGVVVYVVGEELGRPTAEKAAKLFKDGNWKEAYSAYSQLALDKEADGVKVVEYFNRALDCQRRLGNESDIDAFREEAIVVHAKNWRLLQAAAVSYAQGEHQGYIVAGKFNRGYARRGRVKYVNAYERDRVRAMQLMVQAMAATAGESDKGAVGQFYVDFVESENSNGFHAPQEAARILGEAIDHFRKGQVALRPLPGRSGP